jgi:hypothetical protein
MQTVEISTDTLFIVITFVVLIVVILMAPDIITAIMLCGLVLGYLYVCGKVTPLSIKHSLDNTNNANTDNTLDMYPIPEIKPAVEDLPAAGEMAGGLYGSDYDVWQSNQESYSIDSDRVLPIGRSPSELGGVDAQLALLSQQRARDRKCLEGAASRNADFYKYHFSDELEKAESLRWWGNNEY